MAENLPSEIFLANFARRTIWAKAAVRAGKFEYSATPGRQPFLLTLDDGLGVELLWCMVCLRHDETEE